jgi:FixJ family two-component response regulator
MHLSLFDDAPGCCDFMNVSAIAASGALGYVFLKPGNPTLPQESVIAVVDDDESVREAVTGLLKSFGYRAVAFERAEEFLSSTELGHTACLIADVQMPGMTGPALQSHLVQFGKPIPTILITAYPNQAARARAMQNGVKGYLAKPFRDEELLDCIRSALDWRASDS